MRIYKKIQVIALSVVIIVLVGLGIWFVTNAIPVNSKSNNYFTINTDLKGPYNEVARYEVDSSKVQDLRISWIAGDILISPHEEDDILIVEYAQRDLKEDEHLKINISSDTLRIEYSRQKFYINVPRKKLEVFIPEELAKNLDYVEVDRTSADLRINDLNAREFKVDSTSGQASLRNLEASKMEVDVTSGDTSIFDSQIDQITVSSTSGDTNIFVSKISSLSIDATSGDVTIKDLVLDELSINATSAISKLDQVTANKLIFDVTSGNVTFEGSFKELEGNSTSGKYFITNHIKPDSFRFDTSSGDVELILPEFEDFSVSYDTASGELESELPVKLGVGSDYLVDTSSGDLTIKKLD